MKREIAIFTRIAFIDFRECKIASYRAVSHVCIHTLYENGRVFMDVYWLPIDSRINEVKQYQGSQIYRRRPMYPLRSRSIRDNEHEVRRRTLDLKG